MKKLILLIPFFLFAFSKNYNNDLASLLVKPDSYVKDFYLTEFIRASKDPSLAFKAYRALYKPRMKHLKLLSKFSFFKPIYKCINPSPKDVASLDPACILDNGLWLGSIAKLSKKELKRLYDKLPYCREKKAIKVFLTNDYSKVLKDASLGYYFMLHYPTRKIDQYIHDFSPYYGKYFPKFVKSAVKHNLPKVHKSLNKLKYWRFSDKTKWWLFVNAMNLGDTKRAADILKSFKNKNSKVYFWLWKTTGEYKYLKKLGSYNRVNFYTLYAREVLKKPFTNIKTNVLDYKHLLKTPRYNQFNPWDVLRFYAAMKYSNLNSLAKSLNSPKSEALRAIVLDKIHKYNINYFITPKMYTDKNKKFQAFVYAIARQESRFIPASVSSSYALGTMQVMPFLVRDMGGNVFRQFDYKHNVQLGAKHLKWLFSKLKDPLMVAYAYNGGIGFVKRRVMPKFSYKGKHEPFLSMENVLYDESREYGKKVLANYVIYSHIFGQKDITLHKLLKKDLEVVKKPKKKKEAKKQTKEEKTKT